MNMETLKEKLIKIINDTIIDPTTEDGTDISELEEWYLTDVVDFPLEDWDYDNKWDEYDQIRNNVWLYMADNIYDYVMANGVIPTGSVGRKNNEMDWMLWLTDKAYVDDEELYSVEAYPHINGLIKMTIREHNLSCLLD
jgi:hypothetical protein